MVDWKSALLATLLGLCVALPASAQWKWRNKGGEIQYSDMPPPPGVADQDILQRPTTRRVSTPATPASAASSASAPPLEAIRASDPELDARRKKAEQELAERKKADDAALAAQRAENCARARDSLRTLDSGVRMQRINEKGEREYLDDAARAQESQRARDAISKQCN